MAISVAWVFPGRVHTLTNHKYKGAFASERATGHRAIRLPSALQFTSEEWAAHLICTPPTHPGQIR